VEIKTVKQWVMHAQVADRFVDRHERVFLAGDAAHRFPPAGGFGNSFSLAFSALKHLCSIDILSVV
jgi:2-polyprenyl-6-methoxyphenol hydroxylase-like FAD-dependent oxidoreductase